MSFGLSKGLMKMGSASIDKWIRNWKKDLHETTHKGHDLWEQIFFSELKENEQSQCDPKESTVEKFLYHLLESSKLVMVLFLHYRLEGKKNEIITYMVFFL